MAVTEKKRCGQLQRRFGITLQEYNELHTAQGGLCAICKQPEQALHHQKGRVYSLAVDHCHDTGRIRGLLCGSCNRAIGNLKENPQTLLAAALYLLSSKRET